MNETWPIFAALYLAFLLLIGVVYGRQRRWHGAVGWALLIGGQIFLAMGGGELFAWGGLLGLFVSSFGLILIATDLYNTRRSRRRGE